MNIRKNINYSEMYDELDMLMAQQLSQMELYCGIGKAVCRRTERGAAVMASEYLNKQYPDVKGFSPRSLRRMRNFYRTYEDQPSLFYVAMQIGWIQNVVIMEAELSMELREWYLRAVRQFEWTKIELIENMANSVHEITLLTNDEKGHCGVDHECILDINEITDRFIKDNRFTHIMRNIKGQIIWQKEKRRRWHIMLRQIHIC